MEEKHVSEMQSAQAQIQRMQELIDGVSHMELQRLKDVCSFVVLRLF